MEKGIVTRLHSMPVARSSVLWGHVLTSLVSTAITLAIIIGVALLMGFRTSADPAAWLAVAGILALFTLALTWLAVIPGLTAKSIDGASAFAYPLIFLPFISSAFVPTDTMPTPVRVFAENQPVTAIVESLRSLFDGRPPRADIWAALAWCVGIAVVAYFFAMRASPLRDRTTAAIAPTTEPMAAIHLAQSIGAFRFLRWRIPIFVLHPNHLLPWARIVRTFPVRPSVGGAVDATNDLRQCVAARSS